MQDIVDYLGGIQTQHGLVVLLSVVIFYLLLESLFPLKHYRVPAIPRWTTNLSLHVVNSIISYFLLFNFFGMDLEETATGASFGLFYRIGDTPFWVKLLAFTVVADFVFYWFHRAMHTWRPLWRVHIVHHSDRDVDFTDSFRGHPFQSILEALIRIGIVLLLGVPLLALIIYDFFYTMFVFYPHAKVRLPRAMERKLRTVIVTSDLHRTHHSSKPSETNTNFGDVFSFWDRMFGTYLFKEWDEQEKMQLGLEYFRSDKDQSLWRVLLQPFSYRPAKKQITEEKEVSQ